MLLALSFPGVGRGPSSAECRQASISNHDERVNRIRQESEAISNYFFGRAFFLFVNPQDVVGDGVHPCILGLDTACAAGGVAIAGLGHKYLETHISVGKIKI
jgi:hypothetical protein